MDRGRAKRIAWIAFKTIAVLWTIAWAARLVVIWSWSFEPPPPRYDATRDLPPLPSPEENGWTVVAAMPEDVLEGYRDLPADDLLAYRTDVPSPAEIELARPAIEAWAVPEVLVAEVDEALAQPRFAIDCAPLTRCSIMPWFHASHIAATLAVKDALSGRYTAALERLERMLRADRDALAHARTVLEGMVAVILASKAIDLSIAIARFVAEDESVRASPKLLADLGAVQRELAALDPPSWSMETALVGESIRERGSLDLAASGGRGRVRLARAIEAVDAYHEAAIVYARDPAHAPAPSPVKPGWIWHTLDPVSALAADRVGIALPAVIDRFQRTKSRSVERAGTARVALADARARLERAPELAQP